MKIFFFYKPMKTVKTRKVVKSFVQYSFFRLNNALNMLLFSIKQILIFQMHI